MPTELDLHDTLNALGHAILIFDQTGKLIEYNRAASRLLGLHIHTLKAEGWQWAVQQFQVVDGSPSLQEVVDEAILSNHPIRVQLLLQGEYIPSWVAIAIGEGGLFKTVITLDVLDYGELVEMFGKFQSEFKDTFNATHGHIALIDNSIGATDDDRPSSILKKRISGFIQLMHLQTFRAMRLMQLFERLQAIRMGMLRARLRAPRNKLNLEYWFEDFIEELSETTLLDPESIQHAYRDRLSLHITSNLFLKVDPVVLSNILQDILRNAIMYSDPNTPIAITAFATSPETAQIMIEDQGYGIRPQDHARVFAPFERGHTPQVISEFGYGISLHIVRYELETMGGAIWYESEYNLGSTFFIELPLWQEK